MTSSSTYAMALSPSDLPVATNVADAELAAAMLADVDAYAGPMESGECFGGGQFFPQLSNEAQCELVAYHQTTLALRAGQFDGVRASAKRRALIKAHLDGDDERTAKLVGSVFRLVKWLLAQQRAESGITPSTVVREDLYLSAYVTVLEAIADFDPQRMPIFANWVARRVEPVVRKTQQQDRLSGVMKPVELRVLRRMQVAQAQLTVSLHRLPTRSEIYEAARAASVEWNTARLIERNPSLTTEEVARRVSDNMKRSVESRTLSGRMDFLAQQMVSVDLHLEDIVRTDSGGSYDAVLDPAYVDDGSVEAASIARDPDAVDLISFALRDCTDAQRRDVVAQLDLDPAIGAPEVATTHETRALLKGVRNRLSAPHAQFCWLARGVPGQFSQAPVSTGTLVAQRLVANRRSLVTRGA